ncbi:hypothetical protein DPMN_052239 [Dreissena polymorpha]|uniref:IRG-type G domain-containing protein n=1 Tax=Dreissena polymorpha TaxID=45954 RepID=A0A9D4CK37_DREPO|nr:hypothetical protein DPMN_052239 [Dreissena polymorpha]
MTRLTEDYKESEADMARLRDLDIDDNAVDQYDLGSDAIDETILITKQETSEYLQVLDQCGYKELMKKLEERNSKWKDIQIKLAITGKTGSGKSSLINALRGLKNDDEGASKTGCVETTKVPTPYPHPNNKNIELWDLPGVGTENFKKKEYLTKVNFKEYDFIILVSSNHFTSKDSWLAEQIQDKFKNHNLFFIRTKVDNDLENMDKGNRQPMTARDKQKELLKIRKDCEVNLMKGNIVNPRIFFVNNHSTDAYEFDKFANALVHKMNGLKRDAIVLSLTSLTEEIVEAKVETLKIRLNYVSRRAAMAAVHSNREAGERKECIILKDEITFYKQQLGIDTRSLEIVAKRFKLDIEEVLMHYIRKPMQY